MPQILVLGATGYLGRHVTRELHHRGHTIHAIIRSRTTAETIGPWGAPSLSGIVSEWIEGDISNDNLVEGITERIDYVVSCLGVTTQKADPWDIDYKANLAVLADAEKNNVRGFCYVNVINGEKCPSRMTRAKTAFTNTLERSSVVSQVIDPPAYFSDMMQILTMVQKSGRLWTFAPAGEVRINPIHGADLAVEVANRLEAAQQGRWKVGGPDVFTWQDLADLAGKTIGRKATISKVPAWLLRLLLWTAERLTPRKADMIRFLVWNMTNDAVGARTGTHHLAEFWAEQVTAPCP